MAKSRLALVPRVVGNMALVGQTRAQILAFGHADPMRTATDKQRAVAAARLDVAQAIMALERAGRTTRKAIAAFEDMAKLGELTPMLQSALQVCGKNGRTCPAKNTLREWRDIAAAGGGRAELLEKHKGRTTIEVKAWWGPALERFNNPTKNDIAQVWRELTEVEGFGVSYDQVLHYLNSVPAQLGRYSPARIGKNLYRLSQKAFVRRATSNAQPGDVYVADGYRADVYLAHPVTGGIWRPELTVIMDLRSRVIVGWRADEHEGTYAVQNAFAEAFARWNNVPAMLYVDNGSGYKNKLMSDAVTGFYARAGVGDVIHAIPGNPHGKGWIERFFRTMHRDFLKGWMPQFYCGDDMAPEVLNHTVREIKAGRLRLPSLAQFTEAFNDWLQRYARRPHPEDASRSKLAIWSELVQYPPGREAIELKRRTQLLTVKRGTVRQGKRYYRHPDLLAWNDQPVQLEYDLMDDRVGVVRSLEGRWICDATLGEVINAIGSSRMDEAYAKRELGQIKRKQIEIDEIKARNRQLIDADATAQGAIDMVPSVAPALGDDDGDITLDLTDIFNDNTPKETL